MKKILSILTITLLVATGCSNSPRNLDEVQGLTPIATTVVEGEAGSYASLYDETKYSIDNPFIAVDAYGMNPLSAYVSFPIEQDATYSYIVVGKDDNSNYVQTSEVTQSGNMVIPVIGLYADYNNTIEITVDYTDGGYDQFAINIQTGAVDSVVSQVNVDTSLSDQETVTSAFEGGFTFLSGGDAYDVNGEMRVALSAARGGLANPFHINEDGTFLTYSDSALVEMDLTGRILTKYNPGDETHPHHDAISASNGYVYALMTDGYTYEEAQEADEYNEGKIYVWKQGEGDAPVNIVDLSPEFEGNMVNNSPTNMEKGTDLLHLNSITYDQATNTIIVSSQTENMLIGLDADSLEVLWTTADDLVGDAQADKKLEWLDGHVHSNGQHNVLVNSDPQYDDGNDATIELSIFSNYYCIGEDGNSSYAELSPDNLDGSTCSEQTQSDVLIYRVDTENNTIETIDQFGFEGYVSGTMSGWVQSPDYEYSYMTFANQGRMLILNSDHEAIGEVAIPEEFNLGDGMSLGGSYRMPIITSSELNLMTDKALANTNY